MLPPPTDEQILALLRKHGLPYNFPVKPSPHEGSVNYVRMVGDLCVRTLKEPDYASDIWTETVAVPAVRAAGASVPELLVFDPSEDTVPALATIYRRLPGEPLGQAQSVSKLQRIYGEVGFQIGRWHRGVTHIEDPNDRLDRPEMPDAWASLERNSTRMTQEEIGWAETMIRRLEQAKTSRGFVHWDLHAHNILVHEDVVVSIIDWGDAGWGETAINFHCLPAEFLPEALEGFGPYDADLVGRCLLGVVGYALNDIHRESDPTQPYRNQGHRRWQSLQNLAARSLDERWSGWLREQVPG